MTDVVAVGLITSASSLIAAAIGAVTTAKVSSRSAETAIAAAKRHAEVELKKIGAENDRLRQQHQEDERSNRQGTYHQLLAMVNQLLWADKKKIQELLPQWNFINGGVALFGSPEVVEKARDLSQILGKGPDNPSEEWRGQVIVAARAVVAEMRRDIGVAALPESAT